jgi:hypothetical protein
MKKQLLLLALAVLTLTWLSSHTVPGQSSGGVKRVKTKQPKTTPPPDKPAASPSSTQPSAKGNASGFKEVTKEKFKEIYFRLGGGKKTGWTAEYWQQFFENQAKPGWKFMVEEPRSRKHVRMNIVTDTKSQEYRLFFMTEEDEQESEWPGGER